MSVDRREDWITGLERFGDAREALLFGGHRLDYAELGGAARATADRLAALGIEVGDLVAILAPPGIEAIVLIHAMLARGVVMLPLNARLTEPELREAISSASPRYVVVPGAQARDVESRGRRLVRGSGCGLVAMDSGAEAAAPALEICVAPSPEIDPVALARREEQLEMRAAIVVRTSGTNGRPKGAVLGFDNLVASARASAGLLGSDAGDRWLLCMPIFHIGGLSILIRSALVGACVVLHERFEAARVARALEDDGITRVSFVATMLERLLATRGTKRSPGSLSLVLLGGGPASEDLLRRAAVLGYPIAPTYGLSEAASQVATRPPDRVVPDGEALCSGLVPLPGVAIRIVDANRANLGRGLEGEIEVRGPIVMHGYLDDPQATRDTIREGWLSTGDVGRLDAAGRLRVFDRREDLILSGGENIYPAEIESILLEVEGILDAGVCGVPDPEFGARPAAFVSMREGIPFDPLLLVEHCRARLAGYKQPVGFAAIDELPRTLTGKLRRRALRDLWEEKR
ncbi:MAG: AMP-binding protein [bacterium]|nr:2-succinylbenzoate-CoA ligase [Deltaproteobacteria bacterium]MCP4906818.1 AMP-binding protein [bacterium]